MFYQKVNKQSGKDMFWFLKEHFQYDTMNSWNGMKSVANNVKVYNLQLSGDPYNALAQLEATSYDVINSMIYIWESKHPGYKVGFNGRSGGYLVLYNADNNYSILPFFIEDFDNYDLLKDHLKDNGDTIKGLMYDFRRYTELVQDFDKLCDQLRDVVDELSLIEYDEEDT